ncbi:putative F-box/LRR-repeat protein At3g58920 [Olea europaea var. sylvestris]|uniref:putative F-box/LRR-repeat protein At3g58920 n=1 Tax=Olea europaea var. sylvestris TaxID=158386 RepID=UPI000C1CDA1A|nr:putative F-box/LRR-repeat protein At3g58920 [Olea europaea var. sylvestris]
MLIRAWILSGFASIPLFLLLTTISSTYASTVLITRWQYLWTLITSFDFEDNISNESDHACIAHFVLTSCSSKLINRFSLATNSYVCDQCIDACVSELIRCKAHELRLEGSLATHSIFTCKTLTALDLKSNIILLDTEDIPPFDLPNLKKLRTHLFYPSSDLSEKLFSSCPVLEDLTIEGTVRSETKFNLSCPLLKRMKIQLQAWDFEGLKYKFVINAPNLKYLELIDMFKAEYVVDNLTSVVEAKLKMRQGAADEIFGNLAAELLWAFRNLQSLSMNEDCFAVLNDPGRGELPTFNDMKRLELFFNDHCDQEMIAPLINVCPNLEYISYY